MAISLRIPEEEEKLIKEYAKAKNVSLSALFRESVLEKIEDEIDLELYDKAMAEHKEEDTSVSFDELITDLNIEV